MLSGETLKRLPLTLLSGSGKRGRLLIFTYHRVLERADPILPSEPDAATFTKQMDWLASYCQVLPLSEAVSRLYDGSLPHRAASITFDDGYANNHDVAMPILLERGLTATIYVTVDAIERGIMWNDIVIEALRRKAPSSGPSSESSIDSILNELKYRSIGDRLEAASALYQRVVGAPPPRLMMTTEMISAMARAGFEIGAHTVNHPILKELADDDAREEIQNCRNWLADLLGSPPKSFAYPNGRPGRDFDETHAEMIREAGFDFAVSTRWGCARSGSDIYQLPRVAFWDRTPNRFWLRLMKTYSESYYQE